MNVPLRRTGRAAAVLLLALPGTADAQGRAPGLPAPEGGAAVVAVTEPGAVSTVAVPLPGSVIRGADRFRYTIHPASGVRVFGRLEGTMSPSDDAPAVLPVTFALPADHPAGRFIAARVAVLGAAGTPTVLEVPVSVRTKRKLALSIRAGTERVPPGGSIALHYSVANLGNAQDTVRLVPSGAPDWWPEGTAARLLVARGDTTAGVIRVSAPDDAEPGRTRVLRLAALGRGADARASATVGVVEERGELADWLHVPVTAFLGTSAPGAGGTALERAGFALEADGAIGRETELSISYRRRPPRQRPVAFRDALSGPRLRIGIRRRSWDIALGDVYQSGGLLGGRYVQGRGVDVHLRRDRVRAELVAARPLLFGGATGAGHFVRAQADVALGDGALGAVIGGVAWPQAAGATHRSQSIGITYSLRDGGRHRFDAEAGLLRLRPASGDPVIGPAVDASYDYHGARRSLSVRLRNVPGMVPGVGATTNELTVGGTTALWGGSSINALVFAQAAPTPSGYSGLGTHGGALGVGYDRFGGHAELRGNYRRSSGGRFLMGDTERRSVIARLRLPAGAFRLDASAEAGRVDRTGGPRRLRRFRTGLQWHRGEARARLGAAYAVDEFGPARFQVDASGAARIRSVRLEGGAGTVIRQRGAGASPHLWGGVNVPVAGADLIGGIDYRPWAASRSAWRASLGVRKQFSMPVPVPRSPVARGIVFDDRNGNGRRDPREPALSGVAVTLGPLRTTTDAGGQFSFYAEAGRGRRLHIDPATLGERMLVPPRAAPQATRSAELPVVRTASLRISLFLDANGNGERDAGEERAADALLTLTDADGRNRDAAADAQGHVDFDALVPGEYTLTVYGLGRLGGRLPPSTLPVSLEPGERRTLGAPVPYRPLEIRFERSSGERPPADAG